MPSISIRSTSHFSVLINQSIVPDQFDAFYGTYANITSHLHFDYLEIGNEPDHYAGSLKIPFDNDAYVSLWERAAAAVIAAVDFTKRGAPKIQYAATVGLGAAWGPTQVLGSGVMDVPAWKDVGSFSMHSYQVRTKQSCGLTVYARE